MLVDRSPVGHPRAIFRSVASNQRRRGFVAVLATLVVVVAFAFTTARLSWQLATQAQGRLRRAQGNQGELSRLADAGPGGDAGGTPRGHDDTNTSAGAKRSKSNDALLRGSSGRLIPQEEQWLRDQPTTVVRTAADDPGRPQLQAKTGYRQGAGEPEVEAVASGTASSNGRLVQWVEVASARLLFPVLLAAGEPRRCRLCSVLAISEPEAGEALDWGDAHEVVNVRSAAAGTYLSRDRGVVSFHKAINRSAERWRRRPVGGKGARTFHLVPVQSPFEADWGDVEMCVTLETRRTAGGVGFDKAHSRMTLSPTSDDCVLFAERQLSPESDSPRAAREQPSAERPEAVRLQVVSTIPPVAQLHSDQLRDQIDILWWWLRGLAREPSAAMLVCVDNFSDAETLAAGVLEINGRGKAPAAITAEMAAGGPRRITTLRLRGGRVLVLFRDDCERSAVIRGTGGASGLPMGLPTYRGLFAAAQAQLLSSPPQRPPHLCAKILYVNADIVFSSFRALLDAAEALDDLRSQLEVAGNKSVLLVGQRRNCVDMSAGDVIARFIDEDGSSESIGEGLSLPRSLQNCSMFEDAALDYFMVDGGDSLRWEATRGVKELLPEADYSLRSDVGIAASRYSEYHASRAPGMPSSWHPRRDVVPPLVVGGVAFDDWLLSIYNTHRADGFVAADGTAVLHALHVHRPGDSSHEAAGELRASHRRPASRYNSEVAHYCGGWARGKTSLCPYSLLGLGCATQMAVHERWSVRCTDPPPTHAAMLRREGCLAGEDAAARRDAAQNHATDAFFNAYVPP